MADSSPTQYATMIRDLPHQERPRERLRELGPGALSNSELIAILLRTGIRGESALSMANRLLAAVGGLSGMGRTSHSDLVGMKGISEAKASQLLAALELGRRLVSLRPEERPIIGSPRDVANLLSAEMGFLEQEHLRVLLLSIKNEVLGVHEVYKGNVNASIVRPAEVLRPAIRQNCPAIIVVHNHPSGDPTPSPEDVSITRDLVESGRMLDIAVLDHIVIGGQSHVSMKEKGLGFGVEG